MIKFVVDYQGGQNKACDSGYLLVEELLPFMAEIVFKCFDSNLAKDTMSEIKSKKTNRDTSQEEQRHRKTTKDRSYRVIKRITLYTNIQTI